MSSKNCSAISKTSTGIDLEEDRVHIEEFTAQSGREGGWRRRSIESKDIQLMPVQILDGSAFTNLL